MANYINLNEKKQFSGREINNAKIGKFIRIIRNDKKVLQKTSTITL